jgi:hypothetical protein
MLRCSGPRADAPIFFSPLLYAVGNPNTEIPVGLAPLPRITPPTSTGFALRSEESIHQSHGKLRQRWQNPQNNLFLSYKLYNVDLGFFWTCGTLNGLTQSRRVLICIFRKE